MKLPWQADASRPSLAISLVTPGMGRRWLRRSMSIAAKLILPILALPSAANAQSCSASMTNVNFGSIDVTQNQTITATGILTVSCTGTAGKTVIACIGFGGGSGGISGTGSPRYMASGANVLAYQLFKDAANTAVWGSAWTGSGGSLNQLNILLNGAGSGSGNLTAHGTVYSGQQTLPPGSYTSSFSSAHVNFQYGYSTAGSCAAGFSYFTPPTFNVNATVVSNCSVSATSLSFGSAGLLSNNLDATNNITLTCTNGTPYQVGLNQGLASGATVTTRRMANGAYTAAYSLFRDSARTSNWGNTPGADTTSGVGTGSTQSLTVYGRVPAQTAPAPGTYGDTIVVTVTY